MTALYILGVVLQQVVVHPKGQAKDPPPPPHPAEESTSASTPGARGLRVQVSFPNIP